MSRSGSDDSLAGSASGDNPVPIRLYARSIDAALDVATLESYGIAAEILGDTVCDTLNWYGLAIQKVELVVSRKNVAEAKKILAERSASKSENQRTDWICSDCGEVNGREFDCCWSCNKVWAVEHDQEHVGTQFAQPLPTAEDSIHVLPERDTNPYAPPISGTMVETAAGEETDTEIRRAFRSMIFSIAFPPLALYAFILAGQTLSRISRNELRASGKQRSHLKWIMVAATFLVPVALLIFVVILKSR